MNNTNAKAFYGQEGRQLGNVLMFLTSNSNSKHVHGYKVVSFNGFEPDKLEYIATIPATAKSWDEAYDRITAKAKITA